MFRFIGDIFRLLPNILGVVFIATTTMLFLVFPRVVNQLADLFGTMGTAPEWPYVEWGPGIVHGVIAALIWIVLFLLFVWQPYRRLVIARRYLKEGLVVRAGRGLAFIDPESVRQQIVGVVSKVADIDHTEVSVDNDGGRAAVRLNVLAANSIIGPKKKVELTREVKKVVEDQLGVRLAGEPAITISLTPAGKVPGVSAQENLPPRPVAPVRAAPPLGGPMPEPVKAPPLPSTPPARSEQPPKAEEMKPESAVPAPGVGQPGQPFMRRPWTPSAGGGYNPEAPSSASSTSAPTEKAVDLSEMAEDDDEDEPETAQDTPAVSTGDKKPE